MGDWTLETLDTAVVGCIGLRKRKRPNKGGGEAKVSMGCGRGTENSTMAAAVAMQQVDRLQGLGCRLQGKEGGAPPAKAPRLFVGETPRQYASVLGCQQYQSPADLYAGSTLEQGSLTESQEREDTRSVPPPHPALANYPGEYLKSLILIFSTWSTKLWCQSYLNPQIRIAS